MANITKAELVDQVAAQADTDKTTAAAVLKAFEETVLASVAKGDKISLTMQGQESEVGTIDGNKLVFEDVTWEK